ncbi:GPI ethanolamine phosphate transferase 3 [Babesia sp. Xinjiang]|uniref:GPI ethanolamine phosphate transferase 3 n=1 Tax=Babesia sp. Xinjiang TaxID=462227 RepID=UPI000A25E5CC|nr:GPI ethanolamine phosphate transferase 3 [Babesia sp. Xinjiang]ORM40262.1 GPI ethanolamine phosphate transferase 3 [Babesia sp. Xinjiang]
MGTVTGWMCRLLLLSLVLFLLTFFGLGVALFAINVNDKSTFKPYASDRFVLPFPPLFDEFELDGNIAVKSSVSKTRGNPETCWRRVAPEYETYISGKGRVFEYVSPKRFTVGGDMPPGWLSYTPLDSMVLVILDGARTDYALYDPTMKADEARAVFTNHMPVYHEYLSSPSTRNNCRFYRFEAPTPTFTVYSLKCLYTGETRRGNMMAQSTSVQQLELDNVGYQLADNGDTLCPLGDKITFSFMGPDRIFLDYTGTGIDIYDMERPDSLVTANYKECLDRCDVSILHLLAIDHLGHAGKRVSPEMTYYLDDYDTFLRKVLSEASEKTNSMVFVFGDHGQKTNGSHGGGTKEEVDSFLFVLSDLELTKVSSGSCHNNDAPRGYAKDHNVLNGEFSLSYPVHKSAHINMASTLSLLMNKPMPYHSEGSLIKDVVPLIKDSRGHVNKLLSKKYMTQLLHVIAHQMLRTIDTTVSESDKLKYVQVYSAVSRERAVLSYYYSFVRSMGRDQFVPTVMMDICTAYMDQCDRVIAASKKLLGLTNMAVTPEYMVSSILFMALAWMLSTYLILAACHIGYRSKLSESELPLSTNQGFGSVTSVVSRCLIKLILSGVTSGAIVSHMEYVKSQGPQNARVPLRLSVSIFKRFLGPFERWCQLDGQPPVFYFLCYLVFTFATLFLLDIPFFVRRFLFMYRNTKSFEQPLPIGNFEPHLDAFLSNIGSFNPVWPILLLYVVLVIKTLVSQCAILSHDTLLHHIVLFCLYFAIYPAVKRMGSLRLDGAYVNFGAICFVLKFSYLIHYFVEARHIGGMLPSWYVRVNDLLRTFEIGAFVLTLFYVTLLFLLSGTEVPGADVRSSSPLKELYSTPVNRLLLRFMWSLQYLLLLFHYAMKCERHYVTGPLVNWLSIHLAKARNAVVARTLLGVYSARAFAVLAIMVWLLFVVNPFGLVDSSNGGPHHRSSRLFWCIVNMFWMTLLLNGPSKALGTYMFACVLYNMLALLLKLRVSTRLTYVVLFLVLCDLMYFVAGHQDSVFELDFDSAFLFFDSYVGSLCALAVFFAFAIFNIDVICVLFYTFLLRSEMDYISFNSDNGDSTSLPEKRHLSDNKLHSWVYCDIFAAVGGYTFMACSHMLFVLSVLYALSENQCVSLQHYFFSRFEGHH